jgi:hypothetical protein
VQLRDAQPPQFLRLSRNFVRIYANTPLNGNAACGRERNMERRQPVPSSPRKGHSEFVAVINMYSGFAM